MESQEEEYWTCLDDDEAREKYCTMECRECELGGKGDGELNQRSCDEDRETCIPEEALLFNVIKQGIKDLFAKPCRDSKLASARDLPGGRRMR